MPGSTGPASGVAPPGRTPVSTEAIVPSAAIVTATSRAQPSGRSAQGA